MRKLFSSATTKLISAILLAALCLAVCINTLPVWLAKKMMVTSAETLLSAEACNVSAILTTASGENGGTDLMNVSVAPANRILLIDSTGQILLDTNTEYNRTGSYMLTKAFMTALDGEAAFFSDLTSEAFHYSIMLPANIPVENRQSAVLCITQSDTNGAAKIAELRTKVLYLTIFMLAAFLLLGVWIFLRLHRSTKTLLFGMSEIRKGNFKYRIDVNADQEFAQIGRGLNELCETFAATDERRRRFVSDASHELKTPLATVKLLSDSIIQTPNMDREEIVEFLTDISNEIDRLTRISSGMLSLAKLDDTSRAVQKEALDLAAVAETVCRMLAPLAKASGCQIRHELTPKIFFAANYDSIYQIFYNLIENSIKYGSKGKEVRVFLFERDHSAHFIVDDDGDGIPPEDLKRIFDRFYRVDKARARATGGTGLGLSIVASSVKACGGTVEAQNRQGGGARFIVRFPLPNISDNTNEPESDKGGENA
ncbi:MAG: HAMP domain-containing histidine kinase [Ruminococcaceae bacterium]|nr:HAMP domain-containing histidine kinase [Oscillospiraceae bacterium]